MLHVNNHCDLDQTGNSTKLSHKCFLAKKKKKHLTEPYRLCPICSCFAELGVAQRRFAECLGMFQFEYVGDAKTDDEKCIVFTFTFLIDLSSKILSGRKLMV
uniref:Uncharacterized protein n=1 Tax=Paramormyrops kingsleyae TaxID=1676925 RepID=A0A3B3T668_9TELE